MVVVVVVVIGIVDTQSGFGQSIESLTTLRKTRMKSSSLFLCNIEVP